MALNPWRRLGGSEAVAQTARLCEADGGGDVNRRLVGCLQKPGWEDSVRRALRQSGGGISVAQDCAPRGQRLQGGDEYNP